MGEPHDSRNREPGSLAPHDDDSVYDALERMQARAEAAEAKLATLADKIVEAVEGVASTYYACIEHGRVREDGDCYEPGCEGLFHVKHIHIKGKDRLRAAVEGVIKQ